MLGKDKEAYDAFFNAAVENYKDSLNRAQELYRKLHGNLDGFDGGPRGRPETAPVPPRARQARVRLEGESGPRRALHLLRMPALPRGRPGIRRPPRHLRPQVPGRPRISSSDPQAGPDDQSRLDGNGPSITASRARPCPASTGRRPRSAAGIRRWPGKNTRSTWAKWPRASMMSPRSTLKVRATARGDSVEVVFDADKIGRRGRLQPGPGAGRGEVRRQQRDHLPQDGGP